MLKNIIKCISKGIEYALTYCALWAGGIVAAYFLIDGETTWWVKVAISILIITAFTFGFLEERKSQEQS